MTDEIGPDLEPDRDEHDDQHHDDADNDADNEADNEDWLPPEDLTDEELAGFPPSAETVAMWRRQERERRERWRRLPDEPPPEPPEVCPDGVGGVVRAIRWRTDTS